MMPFSSWFDRMGSVLVVSSCLATVGAEAHPPDTLRAIVVTIDGTRWQEISQWNTRLYNFILDNGAWIDHLDEPTIGVTDPMHAKLWGSANPGRCVNLEGFPVDPLHPELLRAQRPWLPPSSVVAVTGKQHVAASICHSVYYGEAYTVPHLLVTSVQSCPPSGNGSYEGPDSLIMSAAIDYLRHHDVHWMGLNLSEYDYMSHFGGWFCAGFDWDAYFGRLRAIYLEAEHLIIDVLWAELQSNPRYAGRTLLLICTDHGRHSDGVFVPGGEPSVLSHGHGWLPDHSECAPNCDGCRTVWGGFVGAGIRPGTVASGMYTVDDLAPTIRCLMGIQNPFEIGFPIHEIMDPLPADVRRSDPAPSVLRLEPCEPNPLRDRTRIRFRTPRGTRADLAIYDVRGRCVFESGPHEGSGGEDTVIWDGRDRNGRPVPDGEYFYALRTPGCLEQARKVVVTR